MKNLILKYLILPIGFFVAAGLVFWQFDLAAWNDIQMVREVIAKNKDILVQRELLAGNLKKLIAQYKEKAGDVSKIANILPPDPAIPDLLVMLEALATANSLQFNSVDFILERPVAGQAVSEIDNLPPADVQIVRISAKVKGSYENFSKYLRALETNVRLMDTKEVSNIPVSSVAGSINTLEFTITINAYYQ